MTTPNNIGVSNFVNERRNDIKSLRFLSSTMSCNRVTNYPHRKRKAPFIIRARYRTRSYRRFKRRKVDNSAKSNNASKKLSNHRWHSKRMLMRKQYGCYIPQRSDSMGYKKLEELSQRCCIIHDMSYYTCVVVTGERLHTVVQEFAKYVDPYCPLVTVGTSWKRLSSVGEIQTNFHRRNSFPHGCIGPVMASFVAPAGEEPPYVRLCIWTHPACGAEVLRQLRLSLDNTWMVEERSDLNRYRLRGPQSIDILRSLLVSVDAHNAEVGRLAFALRLLDSGHVERFWRNGRTLGLNITDPRLRTSEAGSATAGDSLSQKDFTERHCRWPVSASQSVLWDSGSLRAAVQGFRKDSDILGKRHASDSTAWGKHFEEEGAHGKDTHKNLLLSAASTTSLPIALIRKFESVCGVAGQRSSAQSVSGWDVVLPIEWGSTVWHALLFASGTVVAVGEQQFNHLQKGSGLLAFPKDFPDTAAGMRYWTDRRREELLRSGRTPERKRVAGNCMRRILRTLDLRYQHESHATTGRDNGEEEAVSLAVVRGAHYSVAFQPPQYCSDTVDLFAEAIGGGASLEELLDAHVPLLSRLPKLTLVCVCLRVTGRGLPQDLAEILSPLPEDCDQWLGHKAAFAARRRSGAAGQGQSEEGQSLSRDWRGVYLPSCEKKECFDGSSCAGRRLIGVITSGHKPHVNNRSPVMGLCDAVALNALYRQSFGQYYHPQIHMLVLVRNPRSQWLRPALISVL